jgi:hypothetical protein
MKHTFKKYGVLTGPIPRPIGYGNSYPAYLYSLDPGEAFFLTGKGGYPDRDVLYMAGALHVPKPGPYYRRCVCLGNGAARNLDKFTTVWPVKAKIKVTV